MYVSLSICAICRSMERCRDWIITVRLGCLVILLTSSLQTNWCHLIPSSVLKHHWSRASIVHASTLAIAQHLDLYRKIGGIQVLYNFRFVGIEIRDFQKWLSWLCIAARVIPLRHMMSGVLCVDEWMREPRYVNSSTTATCWPWTVMIDGTFTLVPKAWTFVFCQFTSNPSEDQVDEKHQRGVRWPSEIYRESVWSTGVCPHVHVCACVLRMFFFKLCSGMSLEGTGLCFLAGIWYNISAKSWPAVSERCIMSGIVFIIIIPGSCFYFLVMWTHEPVTFDAIAKYDMCCSNYVSVCLSHSWIV